MFIIISMIEFFKMQNKEIRQFFRSNIIMQFSIEYNRISHSHDYRRIKSDVQCNAVLQDLLTVTITVPFVLQHEYRGEGHPL